MASMFDTVPKSKAQIKADKEELKRKQEEERLKKIEDERVAKEQEEKKK